MNHGMCQNSESVLSPEPYVPVWKDGGAETRCGMYREEEMVEGDLCWGRREFEMRQVFRCVSVPGETSWTRGSTNDQTFTEEVEAGMVIGRNCGRYSKGKEAIVKVYNVKDMEKDAMKLHEVVEVVGILDGCMVKEASYGEGRSGLDTITEEGNGPRFDPRMPLNDAMHKELVTERVRSEVIDYLAQSLYGDHLAADYVVLDETRLDSGRANVANLRALQSLVRDQKVCVEFGPTPIELPTEANVLTLSVSRSKDLLM
ncbi:hypothetical protein Pmar_PMAR019477 [Perkinsus marinus ATCC 50983]|uniref:Uncharacterized protein n=1 Tax=Perkinsus marinus (strain ATCC 50983 / TXsc) TaxID=423536 RepID=C5LFM3_PERM5|nr:hypothetical protein Pmar_PMAR019477 [Perkinsus marinus ATCC 50983]EER04475.1 hypothetical protein Pmar_PMAR019477 [Perkinsus marinus ATCC 50983]|eukprot:XP_002772659.1 hypothetical protein Pmar_PMAR019477 [Perkinsus marinus ATCC 50983]